MACASEDLGSRRKKKGEAYVFKIFRLGLAGEIWIFIIDEDDVVKLVGNIEDRQNSFRMLRRFRLSHSGDERNEGDAHIHRHL